MQTSEGRNTVITDDMHTNAVLCYAVLFMQVETKRNLY
jgi:hypothetical protein